MAKSLAKLREQIAKLQKEADAIQSAVIARVKREISQHGLTAEHLFDSAHSTVSSNGERTKRASKRPKSVRSSSARVAKYSDGQGNTWHGIGKRPGWIHAALDAGRSLSDFLSGASAVAAESKPADTDSKPARKPATKPAAKATAQRTAKRTTKRTTERTAKPTVQRTAKPAGTVAAKKKSAPAKKVARAAKAPVPPKRVAKSPGKKSAKSAQSAKAPSVSKAPPQTEVTQAVV